MGWIVSHKYRFVFIHIPKTGGSSIAEPDFHSGKGALIPYLDESDHVQAGHVRAVGLKEIMGEQWDRYFKFAFVRNPWDRMVSLYHYFLQDPEKQQSGLGREIAATGSFTEFCRQLDALSLDAHFDPQISYLIDYEGRFLVDHVGRFESLNDDLGRICTRIHLPQVALPHFRKSRHKPYQDYYDSESVDIIAARYKNDIDAFQYRFERQQP